MNTLIPALPLPAATATNAAATQHHPAVAADFALLFEAPLAQGGQDAGMAMAAAALPDVATAESSPADMAEADTPAPDTPEAPTPKAEPAATGEIAPDQPLPLHPAEMRASPEPDLSALPNAAGDDIMPTPAAERPVAATDPAAIVTPATVHQAGIVMTAQPLEPQPVKPLPHSGPAKQQLSDLVAGATKLTTPEAPPPMPPANREPPVASVPKAATPVAPSLAMEAVMAQQVSVVTPATKTADAQTATAPAPRCIIKCCRRKRCASRPLRLIQ